MSFENTGFGEDEKGSELWILLKMKRMLLLYLAEWRKNYLY